MPLDRKSIRAVVSPFARPSDFKGLRAAAFDGAVLLILVRISLQVDSLVWKLALAPLLALAAARLFALGHDACHGSLCGTSSVNRVAGRLLFLPTLTPFSLWDAGHNTMHHGFTNLKGRDNVWIPIAVDEWPVLQPGRRRLERFYRSVPGLGFYYLVEIWWRKLIAADRANRTAWRREHLADRILVAAFAAGAMSGIAAVSHTAGGTAVNLACIMAVPFLIWGWLIGFTTYLQHTHPTVNWYRRKEDWSFHAGQVESTVHVRFPGWWNWLLHNIYEHTAHHINTKIPSYELPGAQLALESAARDSIPIVEWNASDFIHSLHVCQLYDYGEMRWVPFPVKVGRREVPIV